MGNANDVAYFLSLTVCFYFRVTTDPQQWRDVSFCLSLLTFTDRAVRKMLELFRLYSNMLHDDGVYTNFQVVLDKLRKAAKSEDLLPLLVAFEHKMEALHSGKPLEDGKEGLVDMPLASVGASSSAAAGAGADGEANANGDEDNLVAAVCFSHCVRFLCARFMNLLSFLHSVVEAKLEGEDAAVLDVVVGLDVDAVVELAVKQLEVALPRRRKQRIRVKKNLNHLLHRHLRPPPQNRMLKKHQLKHVLQLPNWRNRERSNSASYRPQSQ